MNNSSPTQKLLTILGILIIYYLAGKYIVSNQIFKAGLLLSLPILIFLFLRPRITSTLFICSIGLTEFFWISVSGGYLKIFHILTLILFISFSILHIEKIIDSVIFKLLLLFIATNLTSIILISPNKIDSLRSFILPILLILIAINVALILESKKIEVSLFFKILIFIIVVTVAIGLLQIIIYTFSGELIAFTKVQESQLVLHNRPPSLFTEADTFGKFLAFSFLLLLPLADNSKLIRYKALMGVILITIIVVMTRSSWLSLASGILVYIFFFKRKNFRKILEISFLLFLTVLIAFQFTKVFKTSDILLNRAKTLVQPRHAAFEDPSGVARLEQVKIPLQVMPTGITSKLIGSGWGTMVYHIERKIYKSRGFNIWPESSSNMFVSI